MENGERPKLEIPHHLNNHPVEDKENRLKLWTYALFSYSSLMIAFVLVWKSLSAPTIHVYRAPAKHISYEPSNAYLFLIFVFVGLGFIFGIIHKRILQGYNTNNDESTEVPPQNP